MIPEGRIQFLNDLPVRPAGDFVLYWMQMAHRTRFNHALEYTIARANELNQPVVVVFGITDDYPEANSRHYRFMLQGLRDVAVALREREILFALRHGDPADVVIGAAQKASLLVCDRGYQRHQKRWREKVANEVRCSVVQIETDVIVPVAEASYKQEFAARTIRPKLEKRWPACLAPIRATLPKKSSLRLKIKADLDVFDPDDALSKLKTDRSVPPSDFFVGGQTEAAKRLTAFLKRCLVRYATERNDPGENVTSTLSPYLHFGQISPLEIALVVRDAKGHAEARKSFIEELAVRRELAVNFVQYCANYDVYECIPVWARRTLEEHRADPRPVVYDRAGLESACTHDVYWNAAQVEMMRTGYMHNYMRMYWGKKIIEWSRSPQEAYETILRMNNKYFLDGRDPNAFASVAWLFGLHDRPWGPPRPIFGTVRYMNAAGLARKFDIDAYVRRIESLR